MALRTTGVGNGASEKAQGVTEQAVLPVLGAVSLCHFLNDTLQSVIPAVYPILKAAYALDFGQIGLITLASQLTASLLQPLVGLYTDRRPLPYSLAAGMCFTFLGLFLLSRAPGFSFVLLAVGFVGLGSAIFHPESSRVARMASGGRYGLAQSVFQVGGNAGAALGPLLAALVILPFGQRSLAWFSPLALAAALVLYRVGRWYGGRRGAGEPSAPRAVPLPRRRVLTATAVLVALVISKYLYMSSLTSYYTFFLIERFHLPVKTAQMLLFLFLGAVALGTFAGGPIGDRVGRRAVIWVSILGVLPFTLLMPFANLFFTAVLSVVIGLVLSSAFSAIVVYAQELMPGRIGTVAGLFFGLAFGVGGIGAALLGRVADRSGIEAVYRACSLLPAIGLLAVFLPSVETGRREALRTAPS
ncbi:MAG TPA: MFS transporter [Anaeromyxobacter sp.]|nr:MFS transporter [Anaeromyxobacter sp.]